MAQSSNYSFFFSSQMKEQNIYYDSPTGGGVGGGVGVAAFLPFLGDFFPTGDFLPDGDFLPVERNA